VQGWCVWSGGGWAGGGDWLRRPRPAAPWAPGLLAGAWRQAGGRPPHLPAALIRRDLDAALVELERVALEGEGVGVGVRWGCGVGGGRAMRAHV
jgi:hypothetical protein